MKKIPRIVHTFFAYLRSTLQWKTIRKISAAIVVFVMTYSLVLPAIALETKSAKSMPGFESGAGANQTGACTFNVHKHTEDCYEERPVFDADGNDTGRKEKVLICGKADWAVHTHDENCYVDGELVCQLPEIPEHRHTNACYQKSQVLVCDKEEHVHSDACHQNVVTGTDRELVCGYDEGEVISPAVWSDPVWSDPVIDEDTGEVLEEAELISESELIQEEVVHHHDSSCYRTTEKTERQLACGQKEHTHSNKCYQEEKTLICGEYALHTHTIDCYEKGPKDESPEKMGWVRYETDENGNKVLVGDPHHLICGQVEVLAHQHTDACFAGAEAASDADYAENDSAEANDSGMDDTADADGSKLITETESGEDTIGENAQGENWFTTKDDDNSIVDSVVTDEMFEPEAFAHEIEVEGAPYTIHVSGGAECGIPAGAEFIAKAFTEEQLNYNVYRERAFEAVDEENENNGNNSHAEKMLGLFDLTIFDAEGNVIKPAAPISVTIDFGTEVKENDEDGIYAVHFPGTGLQPEESDAEADNEQAGQTTDEAKTDKQQTFGEKLAEKLFSGTVLSEAVDIRQAEVEVIETAGQSAEAVTFDAADFSMYAIVYTVDFHWEVDGKTYDFSIPGGGFVSLSKLIEVLGAAANDDQNDSDEDVDLVQPSADEAVLTLDDVQVSEMTRKFIADVENVEFSAPELLSVSKVNEGTTVGAIKDGLGLECEYSAELTEDQIAEINAQTAEAGDWAMISIQPFASEETLTVTMTDGEVFTIQVTDAANPADPLSLDDKSFAIINNRDGGNSYQALKDVIDNEKDPRGYYMSGNGTSYSNKNGVDYSSYGDVTWKFEYAGTDNSGSYYRISTSNGYLYIDPNVTKKSDMPSHIYHSYERALRLESSAGDASSTDGTMIRVVPNNDGTYLLQNRNGVSLWNYGNNQFWLSTLTQDNENDTSKRNSRFRLALLPDAPHVTIHYVDRNGKPIPGVVYNGSNAQVAKQADEGDTIGTFKIPYTGNTSNIDLSREFTLSGYSYASTHIAGTLSGTSLTYDGVVIEPGLITNNGSSLTYYTRTDGNGTAAATTAHTLGSVLQAHAPGNPNTAHTATNYTVAGNQDIYVIFDPNPSGTYTGEDGSSLDVEDVPDPDFDKTLVSNGDGTYTLSLSVTGHAQNASLTPKANILVVVDTSSSMKTKDAKKEDGTIETRIKATHDAVKTLAESLLGYNGTEGRASDTIEMAMLTFDGAVREAVTWKTITDDFTTVVNNELVDTNLHKGTDWEDALDQALKTAKAKQEAQPDEPVYVIFFTDGEPSQYRNFHRADSPNTANTYVYLNAYLNRETTKDEARAIVNSGMHLFGVYAFNQDNASYGPRYDDNWSNVTIANESGKQLLHNLIKYAYNTSNSVEGQYFYSAEKPKDLTDAFANIIRTINEYVGVTNVEVNDNITSLTSVGVSVINGNYSGFKYTRSGGKYGTTEETWEEAPTATYNDGNGPGVHWNLGNTPLEDGVTYKVSFVVWPSQEAYDWVADLNNGIRTWDQLVEAGLQDHFERIPDLSKPSGYRYEVATNPVSRDQDGKVINNKITYTKTHRETVVKIPDGVTEGAPVVVEDPVTGTKITTTYTKNADDTYTKTEVKEAITAFGPPDIKMALKDTISAVEKRWEVEKEELVKYLYDTTSENGIKSNKVVIPFDIIQSTVTEESASDNNKSSVYKTINLGWKTVEGVSDYYWADAMETIEVNGQTYSVGSVWKDNFDIAVGLMLSEAQAEARGIDIHDTDEEFGNQGKYKKVYLDPENKTSPYYVLEVGHDYDIEEPVVNYRFDFITERSHPMIVDGVLKSVTIDYSAHKVLGISPDGTEESLSSLKATNALRGELTLKKLLHDIDDSEVPVSNDIFPIKVTLNNKPGSFFIGETADEENVPWYGMERVVDGNTEVCYFHTFDENGNIVYATEDEAAGGNYDQYGLTDGYYGNIMEYDEDTGASAWVTINVSPGQTWSIANIPAGTTYEMEETATMGYQFVQAEETGHTPAKIVTNSPKITGEIETNHTTNVEYTNKKIVVPINVELVKVDVNHLNDKNPAALPGATFIIEKFTTLTPMSIDTSWGTQGAVTMKDADNDTPGRFSLTGLTAGYYRITEKVFPSGYIQTDNAPLFEVRENAGVLEVVLLAKGEGDSYIDVSGNNDGVVKISNATILVGNTPGAELPHTGGPGTRLFTILGSILIAGAVLLLWRRRRAI